METLKASRLLTRHIPFDHFILLVRIKPRAEVWPLQETWIHPAQNRKIHQEPSEFSFTPCGQIWTDGW